MVVAPSWRVLGALWGVLLIGFTHAYPSLSRVWSPAQREIDYAPRHAGGAGRRLDTDLEIVAHASRESPDPHFRRLKASYLQSRGAFGEGSVVNGNETVFEIGFQPNNGTNITNSGGYTNHNTTMNTTQSPDYQPMRIRAILQDNNTLSEEQRNILVLDIVKPALLAWSAALRVIPVRGNLTVDATQLEEGEKCGPADSHHAVVPPEHVELGLPDTDLIVYLHLAHAEDADVTDSNNKNTSSDASVMATCTGDYLGASSICSTDQWDRPTAALLHLCMGPSFFDPVELSHNVMTVLHELGHALGFNAISLAHFRHRDGTPKTPRDENGRVPLVEIECPGPASMRRKATLPLPSPDVLRFREVRGGLRTAEIVTPTVRQVVRNHFGCQDLAGAELESSDPTDEESCLGDHWERRLFKSDLMNPVVSGLELSSRFSTMTLAYFADSGWYQVDLSRAAQAVTWGRGVGCGFATDECIVDGQVPNNMDSFFCTESLEVLTNIHGCTNDLSRKASCMIYNHSERLPAEFQYFNDTNVGGPDAFLDYCPVYGGFLNGLCSDPENEALIRVNAIERFGARNSRCLSGRQGITRTALCLPIACVLEDRTLRVQVDDVWRVCTNYGQEIVAMNGDRVYCPDPVRVCPTFYCNRDCLGTSRVCDYTTGMCVCPVNSTETATGGCKAISDDPSEGSSFYKPVDTDEGLPDDESPLSDYYVPNARVLREDREIWLNKRRGLKVSLIATFGFLVLSIIFAFFYRKSDNLDAWLVDRPDGGDSNDATRLNRDKHKAMATVVVGLRVQDSSLQQHHDVLTDQVSDSGTVVSTIVTNATRGTIADLSMVSEVDIPSGDDDQQAIMRRRRHIGLSSGP